MTGSSVDIALVVDFLNTVDVEKDTDVLSQSESWEQWARERELRADAPTPARAARAALRAAAGDPDAEAANLVVPVRIELGAEGPQLVARDAVSAVLAAATRLTVLGEWSRLKICPADDCRWAFFDQSRNRSRTWCSMAVCGNREKARLWRDRRSPSIELPTEGPVDNR